MLLGTTPMLPKAHPPSPADVLVRPAQYEDIDGGAPEEDLGCAFDEELPPVKSMKKVIAFCNAAMDR
jgi:hypothetical protein